MMSEVEDDYTVSMKRAILDYVLMNPHERARLKVLYPPPSPAIDYGRSGKKVYPPIAWRSLISKAWVNCDSNLVFSFNLAYFYSLVLYERCECCITISLG